MSKGRIHIKAKVNHTLAGRLKGNTLIEVLVSLSLISMLFVMGMMLFGSFTGIHSPSQSFRNRALLESYLEKPLREPVSYEEEELIQGRLLKRKVLLLDELSGLYLISASLSYGEKELEKRSKVIRVYE